MGTGRRTILGAGLALILVAGLTGCSAAGDLGALIPSGTHSPAAETPAADAGNAISDSQVVGSVVDKDIQLPAHQHTYLMRDGSYVVIDRTGPVPANVIANLTAVAAQPVPADPHGISQYSSQMRAVKALGDCKLVAVFQTTGFIPSDGPTATESETYTVMIAGKRLPDSGSGTHNEAEAAAYANKYIADNGGAAAGWVLVKLF
jgi:hypothetical protein